MTREELLMVQAMEECDEISQRLSKALRFGLRQIQSGQPLDNTERIEYEFTDLVTVLNMLGIIQIDHEGQVSIDAAMQGRKERKIEQYIAFSLGQIREEDIVHE